MVRGDIDAGFLHDWWGLYGTRRGTSIVYIDVQLRSEVTYMVVFCGLESRGWHRSPYQLDQAYSQRPWAFGRKRKSLP